jgi:hypothetical protein
VHAHGAEVRAADATESEVVPSSFCCVNVLEARGGFAYGFN